jgi:hypothetical protein
MGDAGSTLLGFMLACMCISASQGTGGNVSPTTTLWLVAIPLYELLWTTVRRLLKGKSPFHPDRAHFHHKLLDAGFGRARRVLRTGVHRRVAVHGRRSDPSLEVPDAISFACWLLSGLGMVVLMHNATVLWHIFPSASGGAAARSRRPDKQSRSLRPAETCARLALVQPHSHMAVSASVRQVRLESRPLCP